MKPDLRDVSPHAYVRCSPLGSCWLCRDQLEAAKVKVSA